MGSGDLYSEGSGNSYFLGHGNSYPLGSGNPYALGSGNSFPLWALRRRGAQGGPQGPKGRFNTLRLLGRELLSNIIAAVIIFIAAVIEFLAAVI